MSNRPNSIAALCSAVLISSFAMAQSVVGSPAITSMTPSSGQQGQTLGMVAVVGQSTHFVEGKTRADFGPGITVTSTAVKDPTHATVNISISSASAGGAHAVTMTTDTEVATMATGFTVLPGPPGIKSVTPSTAEQGQSLVTVAVVGEFTHFVDDATQANFGLGVAVNSIKVTDSTHATVSVSIPEGSAPGGRAVTLTTGAEVVAAANGFTVQTATPTIASVIPSSGQQGQMLATVAVVGEFTHFVDGATKAEFGLGIAVNSIKVTDSTHATVSLTIPGGAAPGGRAVTLITGTEIVAIENGFTIEAIPPAIASVVPNTGQQGQTLGTVTVVGQFTHFVDGKTKANFGPNVTVNSITVADSTHATVNITISSGSAAGAHVVTMTTDTEVATMATGFTVLPGPLPLPDGNTAVELMNDKYITLYRTIMAPKEVSDTFGRRIAQRYIAMQIAIANRNKDYQWLIQDAGFDLTAFAKYMAQRPGCDANLQLLITDLNKINGPQVSSADLTMLRGVAEKGQSLDPRNFIIHGLSGSGVIAAGLIGVAKFGPSFAPAVAVVNGPFINAMQSIFPDYTVAQENRLSDSAYSANTVVGKQQAKVIAIFIPQEYLLTKEQQKAYWKNPESVYSCPDLRLLEAEVNGNFISTVTATPTSLLVNIQSKDQALFQQDNFTINGTITGNFLANATVQLADPIPAGLSVKLDGTPTDSLINFVLNGTKSVLPHTILAFTVKGPAGDPGKATYEVNYSPPAPEPTKVAPSPCTVEAGASVSVTVTGKNFLGDATKVFLSKPPAGLTPGAVTVDSSTEIKLDLAAAANASPGTYELRVMSLGGPSTGSFSCSVTAAAAKAVNKPPVKK